MKGRTLRPRPFDNKKKLPIVHDAAGLDLGDTTVARSIAKRNSDLEKNNDKVVTVAKNGEEVVPVPGFREVPYYEQLYPTDFKNSEDMNAEYLTSGKVPLPTESACVEYAGDSEDEDWLDAINSEGQERLSFGNFEKLIWKLELANAMFTQHTLRKAGASILERKTKTTSGFVHHLSKANAIKLLTKHEGFDPVVIERVYDYWLRKRRCRKEPLLRTLQPKTPANDRDPDHTFREREKMKRPNLRRRRQVNRGDNVEEKLLEIKDEMGHACNIMRSMINRESVKARVVNIYIAQKRLLLNKLRRTENSGPCRTKEIRKDHSKKQSYLKKDDASYRAKICRLLLQNVFHGDLRKMFASPRGTEGEAGCDAAVSRRLKKAQKRRQKWISYLVQDRNWHVWHDKTWMQKMYLLLRKRSLAGSVTSYMHRKETWEKWEAFVKLTRDRRIKRFFDQKRTASGKSEKLKRSKIGDKITSPADLSRLPQQKSDIIHQELQEGTKSMEMSIVEWAKKQGVVPPEKPELSKTVRIPGEFEVPQQGFPCLPPQLKERYLEAEKDVLHPPIDVAEKLKSLKKRRRSVRRFSNRMDRSDAVLEMQKERSRMRRREERKKKMQKLKRDVLSKETDRYTIRLESICDRILEQKPSVGQPSQLSHQPAVTSHPSGRPSSGAPRMPILDPSVTSASEGSFDEVRRKLLLYLKECIAAIKDDIRRGSIDDGIALRRYLKSFTLLKAAKTPDISLLTDIVNQCKTGSDRRTQPTPRDGRRPHGFASNVPNRSPVESSPDGASKPTKKGGTSPESRSGKHKGEKKLKLIRRRHRKLILELRYNGRSKTIDLRPGRPFLFRPFREDGRSLHVDRLRHQLEAAEKPPVSGGGMGAEEVEESVSTHWNGICSRDGPVAHVPVQSHRLIKTSSAPLLVTDDDRSKTKSQKLSLGMTASKRLIKGKGVSMSLLQRRRKLRRAVLQQTLPKNVECNALPKTKRRKIKALSRVTMDVPSRPERKPMFSHVFRLNPSMPIEKTPVNVRLPTGVPEDFVSRGVVRIGRGSRVWIDRVDPATMKRSSFSAASAAPTVDMLRPALKKVLEMDETKIEKLKRGSREKRKSKIGSEKLHPSTVPVTSEVASIDRRKKFLPHWLSHQAARTNIPEDKGGIDGGGGDFKKEAERLYGVAMEMGVELPIDRLREAVVASRDRLEYDGMKQEMEGIVGPCMASKVITCREASAEGSEGREEWRASIHDRSTTQRILRTESGSVVNVDYLSSIAPRKPRTHRS